MCLTTSERLACMDKVIPKYHLVRYMQRFAQDKDRGISLALFCDLAGMSLTHFKNVFLYESDILTETIQRRVSRAYQTYAEGRVRIWQNQDRTKYVSYSKEATPRMKRSTGLQVVNGEIKIKLGITNKADYSNPTLNEMLGGK